MEAMKFGLPEGIKDGGDTAFELADGMNIYGYMYKVEELEYSTDKTKLGYAVSETGHKGKDVRICRQL